jgi:hypothetical protein
VPWLWNRKKFYSLALVEWHFWLATLGIVLYITAMWVSGIMQGLMWRAYERASASSNTRSSRPSKPCIPTTSSAPRRRAVPHRRADHGLQLWRTAAPPTNARMSRVSPRAGAPRLQPAE